MRVGRPRSTDKPPRIARSVTLALTPEFHSYLTQLADAYDLTRTDKAGTKFVRWSELLRALVAVGVTVGGEFRARVAFALSQHMLMAVSRVGMVTAKKIAGVYDTKPEARYLKKRQFYLSTRLVQNLRFMQRVTPGGMGLGNDEIGRMAVEKGLSDPDVHRILAAYAVESNRLEVAMERAGAMVEQEVGRIQDQWSVTFDASRDAEETAA